MADSSPQARERARRTIEAAAVFDGRAEQIAEATGGIPAGHVLVAVVDAGLAFAGLHHVARAEVAERIPALEDGGWAMVFSPGADADRVRRRCAELADLARARMALIDRIAARRAAPPG